MDDYNIVVLEELKSINRKLERLEDKVELKIDSLEHDMYKELSPIKKHVTQVRFMSVLISLLVPAVITLHQLFI